MRTQDSINRPTKEADSSDTCAQVTDAHQFNYCSWRSRNTTFTSNINAKFSAEVSWEDLLWPFVITFPVS